MWDTEANNKFQNSQARLDSFEDDLGLKGNEFNVAVAILNIGYMLMQVPR